MSAWGKGDGRLWWGWCCVALSRSRLGTAEANEALSRQARHRLEADDPLPRCRRGIGSKQFSRQAKHCLVAGDSLSRGRRGSLEASEALSRGKQGTVSRQMRHCLEAGKALYRGRRGTVSRQQRHCLEVFPHPLNKCLGRFNYCKKNKILLSCGSSIGNRTMPTCGIQTRGMQTSDM